MLTKHENSDLINKTFSDVFGVSFMTQLAGGFLFHVLYNSINGNFLTIPKVRFHLCFRPVKE